MLQLSGQLRIFVFIAPHCSNHCKCLGNPGTTNDMFPVCVTEKLWQDNLRPVIYYLKHLLQDMDEEPDFLKAGIRGR